MTGQERYVVYGEYNKSFILTGLYHQNFPLLTPLLVKKIVVIIL